MRCSRTIMTWLQASVTFFFLYVAVLPLSVLRTAVSAFLCCGTTTRHTLTGYTFPSTVILTTTFLLTVSAGGLVRNGGLSYITIILARTSRHGCAPLSGYCLYLGTGNVVSVYKIVRYSSS